MSETNENSDNGEGATASGFRRIFRRWGLLAFVLLVAVMAQQVLLPFVFALLLAYLLAPIVQRMSLRPDGTKRMPRGVSILLCYAVLLAFVAVFLMILLPRISRDVARIGKEAPAAYETFNHEWAPKVARWFETQFPSVAETPSTEDDKVTPSDLPPNTAFVMTPLEGGRFAVQLNPGGLEIKQQAEGGFRLSPGETTKVKTPLEDQIRALADDFLKSMQSQLGEVFRLGQALVGTLIRGIFTFFLVLMVCAFILIDLDKMHDFVRSLFPSSFHGDYQVIVRGIDRGLSGVIRGQLLICLVNAILSYIGLLLFSVKYSLILAVVAGLMSLIPIFGSILSTIPIVLAALVSTDSGIDIPKGIFIGAWIAGIHFLEGNILNPKIIGTAAKIHPVLVIFALIVGEHSYGLVGALLAVPVASIIQVLFLFFRSKAWKTEGNELALEAGD